MSNNKQNKNQISTDKMLWLGVICVFLAILSFSITLFARYGKRKPPTKEEIYEKFTYGSGEDEDLGELGKKDLLEELRFQERHERYQTAYLNVIKDINDIDTTNLSPEKAQKIFGAYKDVRKDYTKTLKKLDDYEKKFKLQCFARMRTLIMAVLYADKKLKKRVTKFDIDKLIEIGALTEAPVCPRGGTYTIVYKDGRRLFSCSMHGVLKNK